MLARLRAKQRLRETNVKALMVSTVHDSIVVDTPSDNVEIVAKILFESIQDVPRLVREVWGYDFKLPLTSELQIGNNKLDMQPYVMV